MTVSSAEKYRGSLSRLKLLLALSRTRHGLLDMATPAFSALLWLGVFPPFPIIVIGLITTFAGYTAVYALNDVIDYRTDREKFARGGYQRQEKDLDVMGVRHPMAQGLLPFYHGLTWALAWSVVAIMGAYWLNPICVLIFVAGCALEASYCLLLRISHLRTIVSGGVKTSGAIAAVFAVDPHPSAVYIIILFFMLFSWEIGGQNIPNDWGDIEEDRMMKAKTIPVRYGSTRAGIIIMVCLMLTTLLCAGIFLLTPGSIDWVFALIALAACGFFLIRPGWRVYQSGKRSDALTLFNNASYFPLILLIIVIGKILI
ncbi:MAG: UbiA family prenyltransferase [Desulfobacterales bacterium]|nr:UbiA family prenyltransferase [Desulfobacterales bacterium]